MNHLILLLQKELLYNNIITKTKFLRLLFRVAFFYGKDYNFKNSYYKNSNAKKRNCYCSKYKNITGHSKNYTKAAERSNLIIHANITIGYDVDWRIVHKLRLASAKNTNGIIEQSGKEAFVLQTSLDDYYVAYEINTYISQADKNEAVEDNVKKQG